MKIHPDAWCEWLQAATEVLAINRMKQTLARANNKPVPEDATIADVFDYMRVNYYDGHNNYGHGSAYFEASNRPDDAAA